MTSNAQINFGSMASPVRQTMRETIKRLERERADYPLAAASDYDSNAPMEDIDAEGIWGPSDIPTTSVEQVERMAEREENTDDDLDDIPLEDVSAATDAEPRVMDFFNGRNYADGRAAYNKARIARGLAPTPEGRR